jgi:hypothetical protein
MPQRAGCRGQYIECQIVAFVLGSAMGFAPAAIANRSSAAVPLLAVGAPSLGDSKRVHKNLGN